MNVPHWPRGNAILTGIYVSRMLGMFMVFPVFSLYAQGLAGANELLVGIALGAYGLTQGLLQIPFGLVSDRIGRRGVIAAGLLLFALGSFLAATADSIHALILARLVQGMGAISAVTMAYAVDITPPEKLGKIMAIIGGSIGMSFVLSLIIGAPLAQWLGVDGLFYLIAALALGGLVATLFLPPVAAVSATASGHYQRRALWQAGFAIFTLHGVFTACFLVLPVMLVAHGLDKLHHWWIYLPANLVALVFMRYRAVPHPIAFAANFILLAAAFALLALPLPLYLLAAVITLFFIGFYRLETGLPHWVARIADPAARGKAMGIYNTCQFFGSFAGAALGGYLWRHSTTPWPVFVMLAVMAACAALLLLHWGKQATQTQP
ncbi:MAG: MFS transporter [Cardiobacteriaceae bacterium]|nr:MFS transporter [Cardiobacteriaceae bacterium]